MCTYMLAKAFVRKRQDQGIWIATVYRYFGTSGACRVYDHSLHPTWDSAFAWAYATVEKIYDIERDRPLVDYYDVENDDE